MTEKWTIERYDMRDQKWTSYFRAHYAQWDCATWEVEESHTLDRCLGYILQNSSQFVTMNKYGYKYRLREEVSGDIYPLDLFL